MYVGLLFTNASSYQMLRGAVIIFVALFSIIFLNRRLCLREWCGIFLLCTGLLIVGIGDMMTVTTSSTQTMEEILLGDVLIILAQIAIAAQMVYEEKYVSKFNIPPMKAVGYEGIFGLLTLSVLLVPLYYIEVRSERMEDVHDAVVQMSNNLLIAVALGGTIFAIAFYNSSGLSLTKEISATTRMVLDSIRTMVVWAFALIVQWQEFQYIELIGFVALLFGTFIYNNIIVPQAYRRFMQWCGCWKDDEQEYSAPADRTTELELERDLSGENILEKNTSNIA